jgi:ABC-type sugar transport system substrate-binding protein
LVLAAGAAGSLAGPAAARNARSAIGLASKKKVIAFSSNFNEIPVIEVVKNLITKHARAQGYKVLFDAGQQGKLNDQVSAVQAWITQNVPAICVLPTQPQALEPYAKRALKKGLIWTCYGGADMKTSSGWIGFLSSQSGRQVGEAAVAWINKNNPSAKVLIHTQTNLPVNKPRYQVPTDLIKARTKATIVASQDADTQAEGLTVTQATLRAHPDLSVVVGLNDDGALGAAQAFKLAGIDPAKVWISGNDGSLEALNAIKEGGYLKGTAALPIDSIAAAVASLNIQLINHPPRPGRKVNRITKSLFVTQSSPELAKLIAAFK